ncbi:hypothetical protein [Celeribacter sp.]|uniref:hypothetical protein n=1 Tax=Celeribacter sp. TaxID=1890673 RepID=UPI003A95848D
MADHLKRPKLSNVPRVFVPGLLIGGAISRAVGAITTPLLLAGPEVVKRLEPYAERLSDMTSLSRRQKIVRAVVLWLIEERDSGPEATEYCAPHGTVSQDDVLALLAPRPETRKRILEDFGDAGLPNGMSREEFLEGARDPREASDRGVH